MVTGWIELLLQGVLLGGLYALFGVGLSLVFGVMRLVNIAHGDLIVLMAYVGLLLTDKLGLGPFTALLVLIPLSCAFGFALQAALFERILNAGPLAPLLVAFGLAVVIQNSLLVGFGADSQKLTAGGIEVASLSLGSGIDVGVLPLLTFAIAVITIGALQLLVYRSSFGRLLRAVSDDRQAADLLGVNTRTIYRIAMAISMGVTAIAAIMMAMRANFAPSSGPTQLIFAFEAVVIGGLGNLWGTLAGGIILGVAQIAGAQIDAAWQVLFGHLAFLGLLAVRPNGLLQRMAPE
ncbi:branched-chain amino acid ABC transporter permease [Bradyrhizobium sp. SSBR45G]|uniref:branched-chain amino acid ABC transporter permease n=1 Tax=unclassified Bradyrhizobium TaxID=2631580 RepID=UPI002342B1A7|nr:MULTISPECIES: branched-chain amino acid ABC transporter permease [unclassified Bradyrhizobium]GLH76655.1 branched-chain amino acid ABC transporter permease [Bradyrhizobium sp. SSBR45G]GLH84268.1 branched-chain amino acid ABC transporter permease [Bradyrhizobium sp. SSBR45R]